MFLQTLAFLWLLLFIAVNTFYSQIPAKTVQWNVLASDPLKGPWDKYLGQVNYSKSGEGKELRWKGELVSETDCPASHHQGIMEPNPTEELKVDVASHRRRPNPERGTTC